MNVYYDLGKHVCTLTHTHTCQLESHYILKYISVIQKQITSASKANVKRQNKTNITINMVGTYKIHTKHYISVSIIIKHTICLQKQ